MTPSKIYSKRVADGALQEDAAQRGALECLDRLHADLQELPKGSAWSRWFGKGQSTPKGLYLYGGVGVGKSMLMDLFFDAAPIKRKRRVHFHAFMQDIHDSMHHARKKGVQDALRPVTDQVIQEARLLCFDEMQITDITDAMIVGRLFQLLFEAGVVIVTTSNRPPDDLYKDGLNRALFLPFIDLIKEQMVVHNLDNAVDYRQDRLKDQQTYFYPLTEENTQAVKKIWADLSEGKSEALTLHTKGRDLVLPRFHNGVAMAEFSDLCEKPLGPSDYLKLAESVRVLILRNIPKLTQKDQNAAKRFVTLIDALYEAKTKLIVTAQTTPEELYTKGTGAFEFARTASRLNEMQSSDWGN